MLARFLKSELKFAVDYSRSLNAADADFAERILATHNVEFAPEEHAAAVDLEILKVRCADAGMVAG
ncbi:hypothetical protein [Actinoplanes derwentensis]|uniref:Uncharacterized protein n=1 Tax=Actinoplanes derwentensis TaxID=113562 RepID=A0A1H1Z8F4_9ACTN|nr:hypothetical protein [Actinoplanes derwentensis]SDT30061.1 hypothetical protein SAMN04489716_3198 [Actinoplanes derwentensis]